MRKRYGSRTIVVDASGNELHKVVLGFKYISQTFIKKFVLQPNEVILENLVAKLKRYILTLDPDLDRIEFNVETIDANFWDAADNGGYFPINTRDATGPIFPTSMGPQIILKGVNKEKCVRAEIIEPGKSPWKVCLSNIETTRNFSIGHLELILKIQDSLSSTHKLSEIEKKLITLSPETIFALKRSGDWGQVQYCAKYGAVFWTTDKLAAMYACARGVPFVWTRSKDYFPGDKGLPITFPCCATQYTFVTANGMMPPRMREMRVARAQRLQS